MNSGVLQRQGDAKFFVRLKGRTRHLFAIAERRITEQDFAAAFVMADDRLTHFVSDVPGQILEEM